jgi:hypothetical protein
MKYFKLANEVVAFLITIPIEFIFVPIGAICRIIVDSFKRGYNQ